MISYQELVASLTEWRARQGLPTGHADYLGAPMPMPLVGPPHPEPETEPVEAEFSPEPESAEEIPAEEIVSEEIASFPDTDVGAEPEVGAWDSTPESTPAEPTELGDSLQPTARPDAAEAMWREPMEEEAPVGSAGEDVFSSEGREYAEVMEEPGPADLGLPADTQAEVRAVPPAESGLYEADPFTSPLEGGLPEEPAEAGSEEPLDVNSPFEASPLEANPLELNPLELSPLEPSPLEASPLEPSPLEPSPLEPNPLEPSPLEPSPLDPGPFESSAGEESLAESVGDSTMDIDPDEIISSDDMAPPPAAPQPPPLEPVGGEDPNSGSDPK